MKSYLLVLLSVFLLFRCGNPTEKDSGNTDEKWSEELIVSSMQANSGDAIAAESFVAILDAIDEVELFLNGGNGCGSRPGCGQWEYIRNKSVNKRIQATVKTSWRYQNQNRSETKVYNLASGQEIFLGCTAWCSELGGRQEFKRKIVGATYL